MRLGKEQAVGYVEDTEVAEVPAEELAPADVMPLAPAAEASLTAS